MRTLLIWLCLILSSLEGPKAFSNTSPNPSKVWLTVDLGVIGVASADILKSAMQKAEADQMAGLIIVLDTNGGALDATREMVKDILAAPIPIIVWVGPSGAHAGSAGAFITLAASIAAMAPGTQIGAAHPIQMNGEDIESHNDLRNKLENDTVAFMESIATLRGRNKEMATSFVVTSLSVTSEEALENKVIDLISPSLEQLLIALDGKTITLEDKTTLTLSTQGASFQAFEKNLRQRFLEILSNPNLFYLLFIAGILGLGFELTHPGVVLPGVVGALCMVLALISTSVLPINFGGMILILVSIAFMVAELFLPSFGALGIGGFIGFVVGSVLLIDSKNQLGLGISWFTIGPSALAILGFLLWLSWVLVRNQRSKAQTGQGALIGKYGEALEDFHDGAGQMRIDGEIWTAALSESTEVRKGDRLFVLASEGLTLKVKRDSSPHEK